MNKILVEVSVGELLDKISILECEKVIDIFKLENANKLILKYKPFNKLPRSLWKAFLLSVNIDFQMKWGELSKSKKESLVKCLTMNNYVIKSRGPFGEEFVTAGGINLEEINLKSMESRICKGLYLAGEVLNSN